MWRLIDKMHERRWCQLFIANLRLVIGFAFLPAGLKKVLRQPFTDPENVGPFHDFLHAFHDTGALYQFVGATQLLAAVLLMTQRFATLGAAVMLPVLVVINVFCWTTAGVPTIVTVTLMLLAVIGLLLWDYSRWRAMFASNVHTIRVDVPPTKDTSERAWAICGCAILVVYGIGCLMHGGVYRPKGAEWHVPEFYVLPLVAVCPVATGVWLRLSRRRLHD